MHRMRNPGVRFAPAVLTALLLLALPSAGRSQDDAAHTPPDPGTSTPAPDFAARIPFVGTVAGEKVRLRAGPSTAHPALAELAPGATLIALEARGGWLRLAPPADVSCWIKSEFLKIDKPGEATVTGRHVNLRPTAGVEHLPMGRLDNGDRVVIREQVGEWTRIQAPPASECWVRGDLVRYREPWNEDTQARMAREALEKDRRAVRQVALRQDLTAAEKRLTAENSRPLAEQDYAGLLDLYRAVAAESDDPETKRRAEWRLSVLEPRQKMLEELRTRLKASAEHDAAVEQEFDRKLKELRASETPEPYTATGWVDSVGMILGRPATHHLLQGGKVVFSLKSGTLNLNWYVGRLVGVRGTVLPAPDGWAHDIVDVKELEVLRER